MFLRFALSPEKKVKYGRTGDQDQCCLITPYRLIFSPHMKGADVDVRDNSGRKPKHYVKETTSLWIQSKMSENPFIEHAHFNNTMAVTKVFPKEFFLFKNLHGSYFYAVRH